MWFASLALATALTVASNETADVLLEGGRILDGSGNPWRRADIAILGDRIRFVGDARAAAITGRETVDVSGLLVTPGFWDVHSHADLESPEGRLALPLLHQGVTTVVLGIDGLGANDIDSIFDRYEKAGIAANALRYVGHGAAREAVMGSSFDRAARPDEIRAMKAYVEEGMERGALGLSSGLAYNPGFYATTDEVVELNEVAGRYGGIYDTHDRDMGATYQGIGFLASVKEAIEIAERGSTPLIFSHLGALGPAAHRLLPEAVEIIEAARRRGIDVMAAQHVHTASASSFVAHCLPRWVAAGGSESLRRRLTDPADWSRLEREIPEILAMRGGPEKIVLTDGPREWSGRSLAELARDWNLSPAGAVRRVVLKGGESIGDIATLKLHWLPSGGGPVSPNFAYSVPGVFMGLPEFDLSDVDAAAFCPICGAGYTAGRTRCADCDVELRPRSEIEALRGVSGEAPAISGGALTLPFPGPPDLEENLEFDLSDPDAVAYCPSCGSGFLAGPVRCTDCDRDLMPRSWAEAQAREPVVEPQAFDAPVKLADVENPFKANLLGSVLNDEEIWFRTEPTGWAAVRFVVLSRDLERARQILSDLDEIESEPQEN